jgi:hypothetical protein
MKKLLRLFDKNILLVISLFLLAFIPLYPKLPLIHVIRTWVYIRLEDFLIAFGVCILAIQLVRKKITLKTPLSIPIALYWLIGLISLVFSMLFIGPHLQGYFPHIAVLYYIRHIEYMLLFFLAFFALKDRPKILPWFALILSLTILGVSIYGVGQKYIGWPAFSTMNEEFAKGVPLRLPPTARVISTFGGHYDLAAFLVLTIPILGSFAVSAKKKILNLGFTILAAFAYFVLLLTASRVSFGVYLVTISVMLWWQKKRWLIIPVILVSIFMVNFASGASERFIKTLRYNNVIVDLSTGKPIGTLDKLEGGNAVMENIATPDTENLPKGSGFINIPTSGGKQGSGEIKTVELIKKKSLATGSGEVATVSGSFLIQKALVLDISITTRFQAEWPKAIAAFKRNILLGSGYSSLSLASDGNYHRMLGETGLLGTIGFLGILLFSFCWFFAVRKELEPFERAFVTGLFAGIIGLSLNAILIDVFEASKVAYMLWLLLGLGMAVLSRHPIHKSYFSVLYRFFTHPLAQISYVVLFIFLLYGKTISNYFIGDDFTWLHWAAQSNIKDILGVFINSEGFFYRPIPKLWYFSLFSVFWLVPQSYHIASIALFTAITVGIGFVLHKEKVPKWIIALVLLLFGTESIFHEDILWISSQSHLLSLAAIIASILCFYRAWQDPKKIQRAVYLFGIVLLAVSMFSYDPMGIAPIGITILGVIVFQRRKSAVLPLVLLPFYGFMRFISHPVGATGDYAYNASKFIVNAVGNGITYIGSYVGGPWIVEQSGYIRNLLKDFTFPITAVGILVLAGFIYIAYQNRKKIRMSRTIVGYLLLAAIFFLPFAGLGGVSDRYSIFPAVFLFISFGLVLKSFMTIRFPLASKVIVVFLIVIVAGWNYRELNRVMKDWEYAGHVTEQTLQIIRAQYFPPKTVYTFVFVDTPIKYGRAWIFPTGLPDALWHMFRASPFYVTQVNSIEAAFSYPHPKDTSKIILQFEDGTLRQVVKEEVNPL